ncbi:MAG: hypothetical protein CMH63_01775 [Nanoarchaeota archaeon]|nr:hypothetical protein [Nanoarchaeota archaeon]|tara:strand:- start:2502 stop:3065 length:564 start_codon:yes stop_codon:yes gene_type:complete
MKKRDLIFIGVLFVLAIVVMSNNINLSGQASRNVEIRRTLGVDEYNFQIGLPVNVDDKVITLLTIGDNGEVIMDVNGVQKSVKNAGVRVVNGVQVENIATGDYRAILKVINLVRPEDSCSDSDEGDIYIKGKCLDGFYPNGVEDFCDFGYLREYNCGYDQYVDEIHCLKHIVECVDGCNSGACVIVE